MNREERYIASVPDWATSEEVVVHDPSDGQVTIRVEPRREPETLFAIAIVTTPNGLSPPYLDTAMYIEMPQWRQEAHDDENSFLSQNGRLAIINHPYEGEWLIHAKGEVNPFSLNFLAFHPAVPPNSPPSPGPSGGSPFKCTACKTTAKAVALSIVAAASLPVLPKALIAAVATYLGASIAVAAAFISSVIGDAVSVISEKLCKKVGLC